MERHDVTATFTRNGPLGLRFAPNEGAEYEAEILAVTDEAQMQQRHHLSLGLSLVSVGEQDVAGLGYTGVLQMLKRAGRPLRLSFRPGGALHSLALTSLSAGIGSSPMATPGSSSREGSVTAAPPVVVSGVPEIVDSPYNDGSRELGAVARSRSHTAVPAAAWDSGNGQYNSTVSNEKQHPRYDSATSLSIEDEAVVIARAIGAMKGISAVLIMHELDSLALAAA